MEIQNISFDIIRKRIKTEILEDNFMAFDNLSDPIENFKEIVITGYPMKLTTAMVSFCTAGESKIKIGLNTVILRENRFMVVFSGQIVQVEEVSPDYKGGFLFLKHDFFNIRNNFMEIMSLQKIFLQQSHYQLTDGEMEEVLTIYSLMKNKLKEPGHIYRTEIIQDYCNILCYNIYNILFRNNNQTKEPKSRKEEIFEMFFRELEKNYRKEHHIKFYANCLCLTPKYFSSVIFDVSGKLAGEWIKEYIILEAKALLKSGNMTIQQVSDELNFPDQSHFGRFFKHYTGCSPREYQKQ